MRQRDCYVAILINNSIHCLISAKPKKNMVEFVYFIYKV